VKDRPSVPVIVVSNKVSAFSPSRPLTLLSIDLVGTVQEIGQ
jgi:hypothetical protein